MAYTFNDKPIIHGTPFRSGDMTYTRAWWTISSDSEKTAVGIKTVADPVWYDQRFYWGKDNPKSITDLKPLWIQYQKDAARGALNESDWMVVRAAEGGTALSEDMKTYRAAIRTKSKEREDQIAACSDTNALAALVGASPNIPGTASNGATERKKEDGSSYDPKEWNDIANPAALKAWPTRPS